MGSGILIQTICFLSKNNFALSIFQRFEHGLGYFRSRVFKIVRQFYGTISTWIIFPLKQPISKQETFHRYLEKYGVQQIFSNIIQDLYNEDPLPDVTLAKAYFMKKWLNILPCKAGSDTIDKEVEELQRKVFL